MKRNCSKRPRRNTNQTDDNETDRKKLEMLEKKESFFIDCVQSLNNLIIRVFSFMEVFEPAGRSVLCAAAGLRRKMALLGCF